MTHAALARAQVSHASTACANARNHIPGPTCARFAVASACCRRVCSILTWLALGSQQALRQLLLPYPTCPYPPAAESQPAHPCLQHNV
eukprot:114923-Rhodomonas_salina.1